MSRPRLSEADWQTIRVALNDAMDERSGFAEAYGNQGPEAKAALDRCKRYEALHVKMFGEASHRQKGLDRFAAMPSVPITSLMAGHRASKP